MEAPLLPPTPVARKPPKQVDGGGKDIVSGTVALLGAAKVAGLTADMAGNAIINGATNPASLQAVVKITGSNLSLHHRVSDNLTYLFYIKIWIYNLSVNKTVKFPLSFCQFFKFLTHSS